MSTCDFGCGQIAIKIFKSSGKKCCSEYTAKCPAMREKNSIGVSKKRSEMGDNFWEKGHPKGMSNKIPYNKGKTYDELFGSDVAYNLKEKSRETAKKHLTGNPHSNTTKNKLRKISLQRYAEGWDNKAGRCEKYHYFSPIAGKITVDGRWELAVAKYLDSKNYNWQRNTKRFSYTHINGKLATYTPDFYVEEFGGYLEIKGYETELDHCKWSQFNDKLVVWKKAELLELGIL